MSTDVNQAVVWVKGTFLFQRALKNPTLYKIQGKNENEIAEQLKIGVLRDIKQLHEAGIIESGQDEKTFTPKCMNGKCVPAYR